MPRSHKLVLLHTRRAPRVRALSPAAARGGIEPREPTRSSVRIALERAARAGHEACLRLPHEAPERVQWLEHAERLLQSLRSTTHSASESTCAAISAQLDDIVTTSLDERDLLRRLVVLARHAHDHTSLCDDRGVPAVARERARALGFALFDRVARVRRDPDIERLAERRNEIFVALGMRPRSTTLLDWCDVAVRIATGAPLQRALDAVSPAEAERVLAAKVRFDLLAIELNIALDDLADDGRDAGLFALTVTRALGPDLARGCFGEATAVGQYFLEQRARAQVELERDPSAAHAQYIALVGELYAQVVRAGRALAGERWDHATWTAQLRRVLGAMMLSLVQNDRPELLAGADWSLDFHGHDRRAVQAANSNRVIFELVGLWCHERITAQRLGAAARRRLLAVFEELQLAQQHANCLATLERELDEGDRSNCVIDRAAEAWRERSPSSREQLVRDAGLAGPLCELSVSVRTDELIDALYRILRRPGAERERVLAVACVRSLVEQTQAARAVLGSWERRVDAAAEGLDALGFCGTSSKQAQVDLLLLHLLLLKKSPLAACGERH